MTMLGLEDRIEAEAEDVARQAALRFGDAARRAWLERDHFVVALAGGSTPRRLYECLAEGVGGAIEWDRVVVLFGDERCVPADHPLSNFAMARTALLSRVPIPARNVLRIEGDDGDAEAAARRYEARLQAVLQGRSIDLVLLGMGDDGHTASLFPSAEASADPSEDEARLAVPVRAPPTSPIEARVSLSYGAIAAAREVLLLVTGAGKAARLAEVLEGRGRALPIARILARRAAGTTLIRDRATAGRRNEERDMDKAYIGVVGLGVMGENLALNIEEKGFSVAVYNRSTDKVDELIAQHPGKKLRGAHSPEALCAMLETPRRILLMVKAGRPVDATLEALEPFLEKGDTIIDGGNELFTKTEARGARMAALGIHYIGMGVSGGEEGARHGPSLMPGGPREAYERIAPMAEKIAAQVEDGPCVTWLGPGGAGQYVKMVHNGIEYGDMQLIAEAYDVLKHVGGLSNAELADTFAAWNAAELDSFLIEITAQIFRRKDPEGSGELIDQVLDTAKMKGTGGWTVQQGAEIGAPIPVIASAVDARMISAARDVRLAGAEALSGPAPKPSPDEKAAIVADVRAALYAAKVTSYAQGTTLLTTAAAAYGWPLDLVEIARIWKGGCIIRAGLLAKIQDAYRADAGLANLMFSPGFARELAERQDGWRRTVVRAIEHGIGAPALAASLAYYDGVRRRRTPANLVQAQRDFFGAHTYQRLDREGTFHTDWA